VEVISSAYGVNLDSRMLDKILYVVDETDVPVCIFMTVCFITLVINGYNDGLHNSGKFLLIPDRVFHCIGYTKGSVQSQGSCEYIVRMFCKIIIHSENSC
jgi:hypothetical protein